MATLLYSNSYSLRGLVFYLNDHQIIISRPICPKTNEDKIFIFLPKSWVNPFEKSEYGNYVKSIFYSVGWLVF